MRIFEDAGGGHLKSIPFLGFKKEKDLENLVAQNLDRIFPGLEWVKNQFSVGGKIIDTLAYDSRLHTFVIIEYKKDNKPMLEQVTLYKKKIKDNQADCVLELQRLYPTAKKRDIAWGKTRMIFVKPDFTKDEISLLDTDPQLDLCAVKQYSVGLVVHHLGNEPKHHSRRRPLSSVGSTRTGSKTKQYSEADWLDSKRSGNPLPETRDLYFELEKKIRNKFPNIKPKKTKAYFGFYLDGKLVCRVTFSKRHLTLQYKTDRKDSLPVNGFVKRVSDVGRGLHSSQLQRKSDIGRALEYVGTMYQSAGHSLESDSEDENDRLRQTGNQSVPQMAHKVIDDKLSDGKEHTLQELYNHLFKALDGMSVPKKKAQRAMRSKLTRLKKAGKITSVGRGAYKRA